MTGSPSMLPTLTFAAGAALASAAWWALGASAVAPTSPTDDCRPPAANVAVTPSGDERGPQRARHHDGAPTTVAVPARQPTPDPSEEGETRECACPTSAWPDELPEAYSQAEFRAAFAASLSAAAPDVGFEIDCTEFPCLASITDRRLDAEERKTLREQLLDRRYPEAENSWTRRNAVGPGGHSQIEVIAVFPEALDDDELQQSLMRRVATLVDRPREAVAGDE